MVGCMKRPDLTRMCVGRFEGRNYGKRGNGGGGSEGWEGWGWVVDDWR
jgi:hypothetical protein